MPICACKTVHGFDCQFPDEPASFNFAGQDWCRFHMPLQDKKGNPSPKAAWEIDDSEWQPFETEIMARLRSASPRTYNEYEEMGGVDFRRVVFPNDFNFGTFTEPLNVDFSNATFGDGANFNGATFGDEAEFKGATFRDRARFEGATFGYDASFDGATFVEGAFFARATFENWAGFKCATFGDDASFDDATFGVHASFEGAAFGEAHFEGATFGNWASFDRVEFDGRVSFSALTTKDTKFDFRSISFIDAKFEDEASFENRQFATSASFNGAVFNDLVNFHGCEFHQGMSFYKTQFLKTKGGYDEEGFEIDAETEALERTYRTLKLGMENLRARNEEAMFFALEMECRRQRNDVGFFERFAAFAYKHLSNYGQNVLRPVIWFAGITASMWALYYSTALMTLPNLSDVAYDTYYVFVDPWETTKFTLEQIFRPFAIWSSPIHDDVAAVIESDPDSLLGASIDPEKSHPRLYRVIIPALASIQSLATLSLLALFLLALRRRFKMD